MDAPTDRAAQLDATLADRSATALLADRVRVEAARQASPTGSRTGLDRLAELAARLLGTSGSQVSLLVDLQLVAAGTGGAAVGTTGPLAESLCTVTAGLPPGQALVVSDARTDPRVQHLPPVQAGNIGSYLGTVLTDGSGFPVGALCVFDEEPRPWAPSEIATLRQLAGSVMTELELSSLLRRHERDRVRWELATEAGGVGTFDLDVVTGQLIWDEQLIRMFGYDVAGFD